jgi:(p)ppGpp synthase/HD superfamily hydrolase
MPIPGDEIIAVPSHDGFSIHTHDCRNIKYIGEDRFLQAEWKTGIDKFYDVHLSIVGRDEKGILNKILIEVYNSKVNFTSLRADVIGKDKFEIIISLKVKNKAELDEFIKNMKSSVANIEYISRKNLG